jgi:hypothetical protein
VEVHREEMRKMDNTCISEIIFSTIPQSVKDWIDEIGWKREDIFAYHVQYSNPIVVTVTDMQKKKKHLQFVRLGDGAWQKA